MDSTSEGGVQEIDIAPTYLQALAELVRSGNDDVKIGALETLGNLAFQPQNRAAFLADADLLEWISRLARDQVRSNGGALADLRQLVVRDALDMHVCICWLSRHFQSQTSKCVQQQYPSWLSMWAIGATAERKLLAAVRSVRCQKVTQMCLTPCLSCAAGLRLSGG